VLGINVTAKLRDNPMQLIQMLLEKLSIKLKSERSGKGKRERIYYYCPENPHLDNDLEDRQAVYLSMNLRDKIETEKALEAKQDRAFGASTPTYKTNKDYRRDGRTERYLEKAL
jgi:hypothetical protein